jgi:hypothetical protein
MTSEVPNSVTSLDILIFFVWIQFEIKVRKNNIELIASDENI